MKRQLRTGSTTMALVFTALIVSLFCPANAQNGNSTTPQQPGNAKVVTRSGPGVKEDFVVGKVKQVTCPTVNDKLLQNTGIVTRNQLVEVEVMEGPNKGSTFLIQNELTDNPSFNVNVKPGKEVILSVVSDGKTPEVNISDYHRAPALAILAVVFALAFIAFGGWKGLRSLIGVGCAIALIGFVLLPLAMAGYNPLLTAIFICLAAGATTTVSVAGFSRKTAASFIGTMGGVVIAGVASQLVIDAAPLTGLSSEEAQILRASVLNQTPEFFAGLLAAAMLIGALGVIMDVAISIASAVSELAETDSKLDAAALYQKGMNVGRDIMGTMTSTLILAYAGGALPLLLLLSSTPSIKLLNLDLVATEVAATLTGSLGLVCTVPLTALVAAKLMAGARPNGGPGKSADRSRDPFAQLDQARPAQTERRVARRPAALYPR